MEDGGGVHGNFMHILVHEFVSSRKYTHTLNVLLRFVS